MQDEEGMRHGVNPSMLASHDEGGYIDSPAITVKTNKRKLSRAQAAHYTDELRNSNTRHSSSNIVKRQSFTHSITGMSSANDRSSIITNERGVIRTINNESLLFSKNQLPDVVLTSP